MFPSMFLSSYCGKLMSPLINRGYFAVLSLRRDNFLAVSSVNIHDIYLNTQLRTLYTEIDIVKIYAGSDM